MFHTKLTLRTSAPRREFSLVLPFLTSYAAAQTEEQSYEEHAIDEIVVQGAALDRTVEQLAQPTTIVGGDTLAKKTGGKSR